MSQMNIPVSAHADDLERESQQVLKQLASTRKKMDDGNLCEANLAAWKDPRIAVYNLEIATQMLNLIEGLQSDIKELRQQNKALRESVSVITEVLFDSLDDAADECDDAAVPPAASSSAGPIH